MLIDYQTLVASLPPETIDNLVREYLLTQVGDEGFDSTGQTQLLDAIVQAKQALARGELVVEFSEDDESIAVRRRDEVISDQ